MLQHRNTSTQDRTLVLFCALRVTRVLQEQVDWK